MGVSQFQVARQKMIEGQLVPGNIMNEEIVAAMRELPRELFVPTALKGSAYVDQNLEVGRGRYLLAPLLLARLLLLAEVKPDDTVLDIGCASGYSTAVLARLAYKVVAVEEQMELAEQARQLLSRMHINNAEVITGAMAPGYPSSGPYQAILVNGSVQVLPSSLTDQLAEGGRLVVVQNISHVPGGVAGLGNVLLYRKTNGYLSHKTVFDASVPVLHGFEEKKQFVF